MEEVEVWHSLEEYQGRYQVSSLGNIRTLNLITGEYTPKKSYVSQRYLVTGLKNPKVVKKMVRIHRLVAKAFVPNPENKPQVNHKNGNRLDNRAVNLEWVTAAENSRHSIDVLKRHINPYRKLTPLIVKIIKEAVAKGFSQNRVAKYFKISQANVHNIIKNKTWQPKDAQGLTLAGRYRDLWPTKRRPSLAALSCV